jgi:hypothetical protein
VNMNCFSVLSSARCAKRQRAKEFCVRFLDRPIAISCETQSRLRLHHRPTLSTSPLTSHTHTYTALTEARVHATPTPVLRPCDSDTRGRSCTQFLGTQPATTAAEGEVKEGGSLSGYSPFAPVAGVRDALSAPPSVDLGPPAPHFAVAPPAPKFQPTVVTAPAGPDLPPTAECRAPILASGRIHLVASPFARSHPLDGRWSRPLPEHPARDLALGSFAGLCAAERKGENRPWDSTHDRSDTPPAFVVFAGAPELERSLSPISDRHSLAGSPGARQRWSGLSSRLLRSCAVDATSDAESDEWEDQYDRTNEVFGAEIEEVRDSEGSFLPLSTHLPANRDGASRPCGPLAVEGGADRVDRHWARVHRIEPPVGSGGPRDSSPAGPPRGGGVRRDPSPPEAPRGGGGRRSNRPTGPPPPKSSGGRRDPSPPKPPKDGGGGGNPPNPPDNGGGGGGGTPPGDFLPAPLMVCIVSARQLPDGDFGTFLVSGWLSGGVLAPNGETLNFQDEPLAPFALPDYDVGRAWVTAWQAYGERSSDGGFAEPRAQLRGVDHPTPHREVRRKRDGHDLRAGWSGSALVFVGPGQLFAQCGLCRPQSQSQ